MVFSKAEVDRINKEIVHTKPTKKPVPKNTETIYVYSRCITEGFNNGISFTKSEFLHPNGQKANNLEWLLKHPGTEAEWKKLTKNRNEENVIVLPPLKTQPIDYLSNHINIQELYEYVMKKNLTDLDGYIVE